MNWRVSRGTSLSLGGGYVDATVTDNGGLTGNAAPVGSRVQNVPRWTVNAAADTDFTLGSLPMFMHIDYAFVDNSFNNRNAPRIRPAFALANLRSGVTAGRWSFGVFVKNLTNKQANLADVPPMVIELPGRPRIQVNAPRTIGADVQYGF